MFLQTDDQTIDDLRLFSKRDTAGIFDLYNNTHTRGGELLLQEMFRMPLADKQAINRRSSIIGHFCQFNTLFPFEGSTFDMAEKYLTNRNEQSNHGMQQTLSEKDIQNGVTAVIALMQQAKQFIEDSSIRNIAAYEEERGLMESLLADPVFVPVLSEKSKGKIAYAAITAFDVLLRVRERQKVERLLSYIYTLDVYISVAKVAAKRTFIFPKALERGTGELSIEGLYHPELQHPVPNDIAMNKNRTVVFLTGANMAGKSTFLRSVGTAVYIAHMGFPVAATSMEFSVMDGMYTTINLPDNLGIGASHFYAEVLRVKKVAAELKSGKSVFVIFDELFRGTNVKDAHEATVAITLAFAERKNSRFIISSHIVEAADELAKNPSIGFWFLPTKMKSNIPEYTYTLEEGVTNDRHGMIIIRNEGILEILKSGRRRAV
ncbi:MutS-related protein [Pseudobacter ginsenosidimutans]|uniref:MutS-like protein n=1 Tax=Pseudobacter ginsenosidimutans TaxID=661488 RepID=A0A4Q7MQJ7_9BACT|nr:DNA mismatch repair protein [Pseudobacter ginsenosidimutans]QEC40386.1 DNA mismatch repair protein [Pseudobacter ginsenosidimutans]RZS69009.1 MutS-like protein [Pseudobacter ginsenosidimutans]